MRERMISICEKKFIEEAISNKERLDGRKLDEFRNININFGSNWGNVLVALGETKVLAEVSCELGTPKSTRPTEGLLYINVELGPMAAPHFEAGRNSDLNVQISRTLERTYKDSRCIDLESLCITAEERVWILRCNLIVLNHEGNLIDCCSIAALTALAHFKRPDVTIIENDVRIFTEAERDAIPMVLHHYPVCVTYCTFDKGKKAIADPSSLEERTAESQMIFGLNSFRELCCLNLAGTILTSPDLLLQCANLAAKRAKSVVDLIKQEIEKDLKAREDGQNVGFHECLRLNKITGLAEDRLCLRLRDFKFATGIKKEPKIRVSMDSSDSIPELGASYQKPLDKMKWLPEAEDSDPNIVDMEFNNDVSSDEDAKFIHEYNQTVISRKLPFSSVSYNKGKAVRRNSSSSEEEEKMVIQDKVE